MATTRGLEETPNFGSTRLTRPDEEQFASTRHAETTAIPRHAPRIGADRLIRIRPKYRSSGRVFRVPGGRIPDASDAIINQDVYRRGNTAEMGRAQRRRRLVNQFFHRKRRNFRSKFLAHDFGCRASRRLDSVVKSAVERRKSYSASGPSRKSVFNRGLPKALAGEPKEIANLRCRCRFVCCWVDRRCLDGAWENCALHAR